MVCGIGVFAGGEDTHSLRLKSELFDLRSGYANPARSASCDSESSIPQPKERKRDHRMMVGIFAGGEDTHTLRLTSELVDLRVGYANPARSASCGSESSIPQPKERKKTIR